MADVQVGDPVWVFTPARYDRTQPNGGRPGTVFKVLRKYAVASYEAPAPLSGEMHTDAVEFDLITGRERAGGLGRRVKTERDIRHDNAMFTLSEAGLEPKLGRRLSLELAEALAAVVETFGQEG